MDLRTAKTLSPREFHARRAASRRAEREALRERKLEQARIRKDLEVLERLWDELESAELGDPEIDRKEIVFVGYQLQGLYNATENIFRNIAETFGSHLDAKSGWHADLLDRMRLDLTPLRPAVIDDTTFDQLNELRRFRHVFRGAYSIELDAERMALVLRKALALRERLPRQIDGFLTFLDSLDP